MPDRYGRVVTSPRRSRVRLLATAGAVVVLGLATTAADGVVGDLAGGVLYAVLVALLVATAVPRASATVVGGAALAVCVAVELAQLTGAPAAAVEAVPLLRLVLGTTFWAPDLAAYAVGAAAGSGVVALVRRRPA